MNKHMMLGSCYTLLLMGNSWAEDLRLNYEDNNLIMENINTNIDTNKYDFKVGMLFENENTQSASDRKGTFEQTYYFEFEKDNWLAYFGFYQESYNVANYFKTKGRDSWFNRYETSLHYQFELSDDLELGLLGGYRYYRWHSHDPDRKDLGNTTQRYDIQPDWKITLSDNLIFEGWLGLFNFYKNVNDNGLADRELEGETGFTYTINDTLSTRINYYIDKGWNKGNSSIGEFSQQEIRLYFPLSLSIFANNPSSITPYYRHSINAYSYDEESDKNRRETDRRYGILFEQTISERLFIALEYALETQKSAYANLGEKQRYHFHYTGLNISYSF